ncbi:AAA family ATPase [Vibrio parahaemolyticus]|nr:AAA family ATPase [Vibrio parahaemolyticus]
MNKLAITKIDLKEHPFIRDVNITIPKPDDGSPLSPILITGKNGSGKTTLLDNIRKFTEMAISRPRDFVQTRKNVTTYENALKRDNLENHERVEYEKRLRDHKNDLVNILGYADVNYNILYSTLDDNTAQKYIIANFIAHRVTSIAKVTAISKPKVDTNNRNISKGEQFLQYLVNRKSQQAFAFTDGNQAEADEISQWFCKLEQFFSSLFEESIKLEFNRDELTFSLKKGNETVRFDTLSDGYSSAINIITELVMRMEINKFGDYSQPGIVFIDEIETHLHVALQKQILPMLRVFFPNIQFVVTTHSPFVVSSVEDAIVVDMETGETIDQKVELWNYSYEALVEGFFDTDKFSDILKNKVKQYEELKENGAQSREERKLLRQLEKELRNVPLYKNEAIELKLKQLGLK